jgi:filamentous hemagglutinin family protein
MNKRCFKTIFSARLGALVAVGEHASSQGQATGASAAGLTVSAPIWGNAFNAFIGILTASCALVALVWATPAWAQPAANALPTGGQVVQGAVQFSQSAQQLNINQSTDRAAVNWQSFDIGSQAKVQVHQPSAQSVLLNRVGGESPSQIFGQLQANGKVILVNPNGLVIGRDGSVSAAGFTGSTLNISDADFMSGNMVFRRGGSSAEVVNQGRIEVAPGGFVALLGAHVSNEGQIIAPQGGVAMGAANAIRVPLSASGRIKLELSAADINASVRNTGQIVAQGGQVFMQAQALNQAMATVFQSGSIDTSGERGGAVHVLADGGTIKVDGSITANSSGTDVNGQTHKGGDIFIGRDEETGVLARATDASGAKLESLRGFVETSGHHLVTIGTRVKAADWLLDPTNITIAASGASGTPYSNAFLASSDSVILASDINNTLNQGTNVIMSTSSGTAGEGNININESIAKTSGGAANFTLRAHGNITLAAGKTITSTSDKLYVKLNSDFDANGTGAVVLNSGSAITSNGGDIALGGGNSGSAAGYASGHSSFLAGVSLVSSSLNAGGGNISIKGQGTTVFTNTSDLRGVNLNGATVSTSGSGSIVIDGLSGNGNVSNLNVGIGLVNNATITAGTGAITLTGSAAATTAGGYYNSGIWVWGSGSRITGAGAVTLTGVGGGSTYAALNQGVRIEGGQVRATGTGTLTLQGTSGVTSGTAEPNAGVEISANGLLATDSGNVSITGLIGTAGSTDVLLKTGGSVTSSSGNITFTGNSYSGDTTENVNAGTGIVTLQNRTAGTLLDVGGTSADVTSGTLKLGISSAELARISAGTTVVGRSDATATGNVAINALNMGAFGNTGSSLSVRSGGNIDVNDSVTKTAGTDATLSLLANNNITVASNKTITASSDKLNVLINSDSDASGVGSIVFNSGAGVTSNGGNINLGGGSALNGTGFAAADGSSTFQGISLNTTTISAGGGHIVMNGVSPTTSATNVVGILMSGGEITTTGAGRITLTGKNQLSGTTGATGTGFSMSSGTITGGSTGALTIEGNSSTSSVTSVNNKGAIINGTLSSTGGDISITGTGGSGAQYDNGVDIGGNVLGVGSANVTVSGTAAPGSSGGNVGVTTSGTATVSSVNGNINITGTGGVGNGSVIRNHGVSVGSSNAIQSTGSGNVTVTGRSINSDTNFSQGVVIGGAGLRTNSGNIRVDGQTLNNHQVAVNISAPTAATTGNVYIRSVNAGITNSVSGVISGNNVSIENTAGTIDANGVITPGAGGATTWVGQVARNGIDLNGSVTAANNLNIYGNQTNTDTGVKMSGATTTISGKNVTLYGRSGTGNGVLLSGATLSGAYLNVTGLSNTGKTGFAWQGGNINTTDTSGTSTASVVKGLSGSTTTTDGFGAFMTFGNGAANASSGTTLTLAGEGTALSTGLNTKQRGILVRDGNALTMSGDVTLDGSSRSSEGISFGGTLNMATVAGVTNKLTIRGTSAASINSGLNAVNLSGVINSNASTSSINLIGDAKNLSGSSWDNAVNISGAINGGTSNVNIQSTGANITTSAAIAGANISIDNTNGTIHSSTGAITAGSGTAGSAVGIDLGSTVTATGNLNVFGASTGNIGLRLVSSASISGGNIQATGRTTNGANGVLLNGTNTVTTTGSSGDSQIKGMTTSGGTNALLAWGGLNLTSATGTTLTLWGDGTNTSDRATRFDGGVSTTGAVTLKGTSNNATSLMFINGAVTANANSALTLSGTTSASNQSAVYFVNSGGVALRNGATVNITGQNTTVSGPGTGVLIQGNGIYKAADATSAGAVTITGSVASGTTGSTGVSIQAGVSTDGNIDIQGNVASATSTGVSITSSGGVASSGTNSTINIGSNFGITHAGYMNVSGATGTGSNINLTSTNNGISGAGTIGTTTHKNASVKVTQAGISTFSGAINAANFNKAGAGSLTLDSWVATAPVTTNISNAYTVESGGLTLNPGSTLAWITPANVNVVNASTFSLATNSNSRWNNTAFNFTGGSGGGTMNLGGNPIGAASTTNTFSTTGGATNTILGGLNANGANINFNLTEATSGTALLDGGFASMAFTQSAQSEYGIGSAGAGGNAGTVNMSGGGHLLFKDKVRATTFNINAGNLQVGDGSAATFSATAILDATNVSIAAGSKLTFNRAETYSNGSAISGAGSLIQAGAGTLTLTGNSSGFAGSTTVNAGRTLAIGTGGSLGAAGSTLSLASATASVGFANTSGTSTIGSTISGAGTLSKSDAGTGVLTADNTYTGTTTVSGGTLQIGNGGTTGTLGTGGAVTLSNNANLSFLRSAVTTIDNSISGTGNVSAAITGASSTLTVSSGINLSSGTVNLAADNNLSVTAAIGTTNTTNSAVLLNAGASTNAGTSAGGNLLFSGSGAVTVGSGGLATLMTGSVSGSSGLTALVGSGSGNFRYNSDERSTGYTTALGTGLYAIYREAPSITASLNNDAKTYDGLTYSGGNGVGAFSGLANGDTAVQLGVITYGGAAQTAKNFGSYALTGTAASGVGYAVTLNAAALSINKANLSQVTASKTYDGLSTVTAAQMTAVQGVNGETFSATSGTAVISDKNVATASKTLTDLTGLTLSSANGGLVSNYNLSSGLPSAGANNAVTIGAANLTLSGTRVYDGSQTFAGQYLTATGVNSETFALTGPGDASNLSSKNLQNGSVLGSVTGLSLDASANGGLATNYNALSTTGSSVSVTARAATFAATATNLTYSGTVQHQAASTKSGFVAGDALTFAGEASGTNAGTYGSNLSVSGADFNNYTVTLTNANLVIDKANLTLSGTRVYDATQTFAGSHLTAFGVNGETFAITGAGDTGNLASKNVQTNQALNSITGLALGTSANGGLSTNYNALSATGSNVNVTAKSATVDATPTMLTYNGFTQTQQAATSSGFIAGDVITITGLATGKNFGSYSSALAVSGADAGNYNVTRNEANLQITKAMLTATGNSSTVTYNGANQSVNGYAITGLLGTDTVSDLTNNIVASGATGQNAGNYTNTVTAGAQTNYTVSTVNGTLSIAKAPLTATGKSSSVTYNGFNQSVAADFDVTGLQGNDTKASLSSISALGATGKNAGNYANVVTAGTETNYTVTPVNGNLQIGKASLTATGNSASVTYNGATQTVAGFTVSGLLGSDLIGGLTSISASGASGKNVASYTNTVTAGTETNYTVSTVNGSLQIGRANLTLSGSKVYDTSTSFAGSALTALGAAGETFSVTGAGHASNLASKDVQSAQLLSSVTGLALGTSSNGGLSANYNDLSTTGSSVSVTPAAATVTGTLTNVTYNGATQTQSAPATSGFFGGDVITVSGLASGKNAGTYTSTLAVGGADAGNYTVTYTNSNLLVAQAPLAVTATQVTKTYDAGLGAAGHGSVGVLAGAAMGDVVNSAGVQAFLDKDAGIGKTVRASGVTIKDAANGDMTGNYAITYVDNTTSVINKAPLTVTANADVRFVTQSDAALFNGVSYSGLVGGEDSTLLGGTLGISRTNAVNEVAAGTYTGVLVPIGLTSNNYDITFANGNYQIIPANQLLIRTTNESVVYGTAPTYSTTAQYLLDDGVNPSSLVTLSRTGSANNYTFSDGAGGSVSTLLKPYLNNAAAAISGSTNTVVGTYDVMDLNPTVVGGNFVGAPVFVGALTIKTKDVAPSATSVSKVYDGTTSMNNVVVGMTGQITGDNLAISGSGAFTQKNAGTGLGYTVSNIALSGSDAANYHLSGGATSFSGASGIITAAPLVLTSSNVTKTYDRTTVAAGSAVSTQGTQLFGSDSLSGGNFAFTNVNAGVNSKTVTVSGVTVNDGNGGANYAVSYASNTTSTINPKALNASYTASSKTYNGNLTASVSGGSDDIIGGDAVNFTNTSATFDTKNVGTGKTVTVSGISISGADAGNYSLQSTTVTSTADITAKALTASFTGTSKVYDGGVVASVTGSSADMVAGDVLTYNVTSASYDNKNVGTNKQITASGITLGGADAGNYLLQYTTATTTGAITRKDVTLSAITASGKTYDGTVAANITAGSITTGVAGETLSVSGSGTFDTKNVGLGKTVTVADVGSLSKLNGTGDWDNYNLATTGAISTTAGITQAALTVTASAVSKTYDGTLSAGGSGVVGALAGAGDAVSGIGAQNFLDKNAGTGKTLRASGVTIQDASNADMTGNYLITYVDNTGGVINSAPLEVAANSITKTYDGTLSAAGAAMVRTGTLFAGDALSGGTLAFTDKNQGVGNKTVTVSGVTVGDGVNFNNYDVTYANNTTSTINKANLTVTAAAVTKTYDGTLSAVGTGSLGTLAGAGAGETVDVAGTLAFLDANAGTGKTVRASGVTIKDAGNADVTGNYAITYLDNSNGVINKAALTASLLGPISKQYDGTVAASGLTNANFSVTGWANAGEGVSVNLTTANYADPNVAANGGTGAVSAVLLDSDFSSNGATNLANYTLPSTASGNVGTITPAPLTVKVNNTAMFVTQNPNTAFDQGFSYTGLKNGETGSAVLGTLTRTYAGPANPATGSYSAVYELTTTPTAANYTVTAQKGDLTVARADQLLLNVGSANATYGALSADNAAASATLVTAQYCLVSADCNAGNIANLTMSKPGAGRWTATDSTNSTISFNTVVDTSGQISGAGFVNVGQYGFDVNSLITTGNVNFNGSVISGGLLTVTPKALTFNASNVTKVYDGTTALAAMGLTPTGKLSGDQVSVASSGGTFAGKNVGSQNFSLAGLQLQGADRANYTFSTNTVSGTGTITPKTLTLSASASDKVYDGNATASVGALGLSGVIAGDAVSATGGTASFSDKNVARNASGSVMAKSVSISGVTLTGADAANYQTDSSASASAAITPLTINASVTALNKVYDGTAQAQVSGTVTGALGSDAVSVTSTSSNFASKNVVRDATGQPTSQSVNVAGLTLAGADAGNYNLASTTASGTATITPKLLSASGAVADKVYDGNATASLSGLNGTGLLAGDSVSVDANIAHFEDKLVSRDANGAVMTKRVTVEGLRLAGSDAGNYALLGSSLTARAKILPRELDVLVNAQDKVYDGSAVATGSLSLSHVVAGDVLALSWGKGSFDSKDVQRNAQGGVQAQGVRFESVRLSGVDSANYSLKIDTASGMATITPKRLEVIGTQVTDKKEDGSVRADVRMGTLSGMLGAEQLRAWASGQFRTPGAGQDKPVDVLYSLQDGENGGKAGNYQLVGQTLKASITPVNALQLPRIETPIASKNSRLRVLFEQSRWASFAPAQSSNGRTGDVSVDPAICTAQTPNTCSCNVDMGTGVEICLPVRGR